MKEHNNDRKYDINNNETIDSKLDELAGTVKGIMLKYFSEQSTELFNLFEANQLIVKDKEGKYTSYMGEKKEELSKDLIEGNLRRFSIKSKLSTI